MNRTLFSCGIKRTVTTRKGQEFDVSATFPRSVKLLRKPVKCDICNESFTAKNYLETHIRFKHSSDKESKDEIRDNKDQTEYRKLHQNEETPTPSSSEQAEQPTVQRKSATIDKEDKRRGQSRRKSYTVAFKLETLKLLDSLTEIKFKNKRYEIVARERGISRSLVIKWDKNKARLKKEVELNKHKGNKGNVRAGRQRRKLVDDQLNEKREKYPLAAARVVVEFKLRRAKGCKVSKLWLKKKMKLAIEACYGKDKADKFKASNNWFDRFKKRHGISFRRRSNKKKNSAEDGRETIQRFHRDLRKAVKSKRRRNKSRMHNSAIDKKYGRWSPKNRYNIDQVPLPFVIDQDKTYDITGNKQVWVSQPSTGLDKRQATLQLCIRAKGEQNVKPGIVFRGKGHVTSAERAEYDEGVDVYFQECAWMDHDVNMKWVSKTLIPGIGNSSDEKVIFADNVGFQLNKEFHEACRKKANAVVYLLPENHTDKVQPIDAGCGKLLKTKIGEAMERWLEEDDNLELWHDKISAKQRRVLMTKWTAEAWKELTADKLFFMKLFERTGCLITADGSDDDKIRPQALEPYSF